MLLSTNFWSENFVLTQNKNRLTKKETILFTLSVTSGSVPDGTEYDWLLFGSIVKTDFVGGTTVGKIRMSKNIGTVNLTISDTISIASEEEITFNILGPGVNAFFTIYNSSSSTSSTPLTPTFVVPKLGTPVVSSSGKILSIPIVDPGDRYTKPPFIRIYGEGYGGSASAVLDETGKITKIKVERPGSGYVPNKSNKTNCYVDGFIVIRPGYGYTSAPSIYVDGEKTLAEAVISNGYVSEIKIINKIKTFNDFPKVEVIGGGGNGALIMPSFTCLEEELFKKYAASIAPSGVTEVVDCPGGDCSDCTT